jgi:ABC-type Fe3+/spermidine/putrescine transport system ATPase subunit
MVHLKGVKSRRPSQLSGGQQQRIDTLVERAV